MDAQLIITYGDKTFIPAVKSGIKWNVKRRGSPGKLTFSIVEDGNFSIGEGAAVNFQYKNEKVFFGFVFSLNRKNDGLIEVTAYDQLRYLKNKDTRVYTANTAGQLVRSIADDYRLQTGVIEDTGFVIASRVEENTSLFDMIENALDLTLMNTKERFVLYDDFGKLSLKNISSMYVGDGDNYLMIDEETGESFDYKSSIDDDVYNKIKLTYDNEGTGKREVYIAQNSSHINEWGVLQYFDTLKEGENGQAKADALLKLYDKKYRSLKITKAFGDTRVRAGSLVLVKLRLGDVDVKNFMLAEEVSHNFEENQYTMDLTLKGGVING